MEEEKQQTGEAAANIEPQAHYERIRAAVSSGQNLAQITAILEHIRPPSEVLLHMAAEKGDLRVCKALLNAGAAIDAKDHSGRTPLHIAAEIGYNDFARLLLDKGANKEAQTQGSTPWYHSAMDSYHEVTRPLSDTSAEKGVKPKALPHYTLL